MYFGSQHWEKVILLIEEIFFKLNLDLLKVFSSLKLNEIRKLSKISKGQGILLSLPNSKLSVTKEITRESNLPNFPMKKKIVKSISLGYIFS